MSVIGARFASSKNFGLSQHSLLASRGERGNGGWKRYAVQNHMIHFKVVYVNLIYTPEPSYTRTRLHPTNTADPQNFSSTQISRLAPTASRTSGNPRTLHPLTLFSSHFRNAQRTASGTSPSPSELDSNTTCACGTNGRSSIDAARIAYSCAKSRAARNGVY